MLRSTLRLSLVWVATALILSACSAVLDDPLPYPEEPQEVDMYIPPPPDLSVTPSTSDDKSINAQDELEGGAEAGAEAGVEG